jgi:CRISPR-associated endonuclease/helicase Cas3
MMTSPELSPDMFSAFFEALHGYKPFHWQTRLALQVCEETWPRFIKLPTASGKTSCIDIAVFSLAYQAWRHQKTGSRIEAPRRIFFVVDRRIIVNEAYRRACHIRDLLNGAIENENEGSPLSHVAWWLRLLAAKKSAPPLDCYELRGGIYRDDAWVRSLLQPTVLTSTVDQIGSRLLFRGYGVSDRNLPIHAALTANDALIFLDEAHCSKPFSQTVQSIARYRDANLEDSTTPRWAHERIATPFRFVEMTATPQVNSTANVLELTDQDYVADTPLQQRHGCAKPVQLVDSKAIGKNQNETLAKDLVKQAIKLAKGSNKKTPCHRIAIVVNRVDCARSAFKILQESIGNCVDLMIGRMRPIDRDQLTERLQKIFHSGSQESLDKPHFIVATQCLEVGADYDFDGMVCQCASLDALRQRFGRLNRLGKSDHAQGVIVMASGDLKPKRPDPIYGNSLPATWKWLSNQAQSETIDFGIRSLDEYLENAYKDDPTLIDHLSASSSDAPVLMPAHLDILCQTGPRPALEPDIAAYLHGPDRGVPEVRVCWRADLPEPPVKSSELEDWAKTCFQVITPCPPSSAECINVPLAILRRWLQNYDYPDNSGDVIGQGDINEEAQNTRSGSLSDLKSDPKPRCAIIWNAGDCRGISSCRKQSLDSILPYATIILPASIGGWNALGHVPGTPQDPSLPAIQEIGTQVDTREQSVETIDIASESFRQTRGRYILRIHPGLASNTIIRQAFTPLFDFVEDEHKAWQHEVLDPSDVEPTIEGVDEYTLQKINSISLVRKELYQAGSKRVNMIRYPGGIAIIGPRVSTGTMLPRESFDDEYDEHNLEADTRISLADHIADVSAEVERLVSALDLPERLSTTLIAASERHDLGKADPRFQAKLLNTSLDMAYMQPRLWAKSTCGASILSNWKEASLDSTDKLPAGFRHEMLSMELAKYLHDNLAVSDQALMLHLIAAHHGHARPFAPVVIDESPLLVSLEKLTDKTNSVSGLPIKLEDRRDLKPAHRLNSGISERFWQQTRRYGWWGLAWLESTVRLADWVASAQPISAPARVLALRKTVTKDNDSKPKFSINFPGINGANPLGFLAAIGLFRTLSRAFPDQRLEFAWQHSGIWHPVLITNTVFTEENVISSLHGLLANQHKKEQFTAFGKNININLSDFRTIAIKSVESANQKDRIFTDFCAAFGSDALISPNDKTSVQNTALRTMAGAGHQHFLETMRNLIQDCTIDHLHKTLFQAWRYDDPTQTLSLRFDPLDDNRYALRWRNPSGDPDRQISGSMLGANRLAIEAFPLFPTVPGRKWLKTTAFKGNRSNDTFFHWPIWIVPIPLSVIQTLLMLAEIIKNNDTSKILTARGIITVMRSQRITVGKVRNFTPPIALFTAVDEP